MKYNKCFMILIEKHDPNMGIVFYRKQKGDLGNPSFKLLL